MLLIQVPRLDFFLRQALPVRSFDCRLWFKNEFDGHGDIWLGQGGRIVFPCRFRDLLTAHVLHALRVWTQRRLPVSISPCRRLVDTDHFNARQHYKKEEHVSSSGWIDAEKLRISQKP